MKCKICEGTEKDFGTTKNKVTIKMPDAWDTDRDSRYFDIDSCMVPEISFLWREGVRTIECCCGHGKVDGYIAVDEGSERKMHNLGYVNIPFKKDRDDLFLPRFNKRIEYEIIRPWITTQDELVNKNIALEAKNRKLRAKLADEVEAG